MNNTEVTTRQRRVFVSRRSAFVRISSSGIICSSLACCRQSLRISVSALLSIAFPFAKTLNQELLDTAHLCRHVGH